MTSSDAIGGYFELALPPASGEYHAHALRLQSARAALLALLQHGRPTAVWMPWYICDSMLEPLLVCGIPVKHYALDSRLGIAGDIPLAAGEWLLYVNYFGLCQQHAEQLAQRLPRDRLMIDHSQAFFAPAVDCLANIYSPRKFFGVPDGGYLLTSLDMPAPAQQDTGSAARCRHLLQRLDGPPEPGYADYMAAESSLSQQAPLRMSTLTQRLLGSIDYAGIQAQRRSNYAYLAQQLAPRNQFQLPLDADAVPLCYPLLLADGSAAQRRTALARQRIYLPAYWPEVAQRAGVPPFDAGLAAGCLFLPCDQRLQQPDLDRLIAALLE
jgi:hypothetical protein